MLQLQSPEIDRLKLKIIFLSFIILISAILYARQENEKRKFQTLFCGILSVIGYLVALRCIPAVKSRCVQRGLAGGDAHKPYKDQIKIPESLGIVVGTVYLVVVILFQPFFTEMLGAFNAALMSITMMLFLGFVDDVLDVRWSIKISLSFLAILPLLMSYSGATNIIVPKPFRPFFGYDIHLGVFYHVYMCLTAVFSTNSINIYAGINGLECGQSLIIACSILVHNYMELNGPYGYNHNLSLVLILPFLACSSALFVYNSWPSEVFVGDSFTYFSGMTLAVAGIQGHFSKTLLLFFVPQLINFVLSIPQLFKIVECPRHRMPAYIKEKDLVKYSTFKTKSGKELPNLTLINAFLYFLGPMNEGTLTIILMLFQIFCCGIAFAVRYSHAITNVFYDSNYHLLE